MDNQYNQYNQYNQQQGNSYQQGNINMGNGYGYGNYGGNAEPQKAPNIFQQFVLAFVPSKYDRLTKVKTGSMIGFVTLLVLAAALLSFFSVAIELASIDMKELAGKMPDFTITGGRLYMDEDFWYDEGSVFVYMTEDIDEFSYEDAADLAAEGYQDIILVGRDRISVMQNWEYQQINFSDFGDTLEIRRERIAIFMGPFLMVILIFAYLIIFVGMGLGYFLFAAVYLLFAMLIALIMRKRIEAGALFRVAVYSKVLMFVAATILDLIPFVSFSVPFWSRVAITIGFMAFVIAKLPDNRPAPMPMGPGMGQNQWQGWQ